MKAGSITFAEHKNATAQDCEAIAETLKNLAAAVREGNMTAFEEFWIEGGTEEGDAKIKAMRELIIMRYLHRHNIALRAWPTEQPEESHQIES
jgi:hypothetical protein